MKKFLAIILATLCMSFVGCSQASSVTHNIQRQSEKFDTYRRMTFINLNTDKVLYTVEGYFSVQTTVHNEYQGQQELGVVIKVSEKEYTLHYFSIDNNVTYVIEQIKNTHTNPYHWEINMFVPIPDIESGY